MMGEPPFGVSSCGNNPRMLLGWAFVLAQHDLQRLQLGTLWVPETRPGSRDLLIFVEETAEPVEATDAAGVGQVVFGEAA
jgi:hypothetical protein